jgi:hypothetical protein
MPLLVEDDDFSGLEGVMSLISELKPLLQSGEELAEAVEAILRAEIERRRVLPASVRKTWSEMELLLLMPTGVSPQPIEALGMPHESEVTGGRRLERVMEAHRQGVSVADALDAMLLTDLGQRLAESEPARVVLAQWDDEAKVWFATSEDVPGLVTEAASFEVLRVKLRELVPELLRDNAAKTLADLGGTSPDMTDIPRRRAPASLASTRRAQPAQYLECGGAAAPDAPGSAAAADREALGLPRDNAGRITLAQAALEGLKDYAAGRILTETDLDRLLAEIPRRRP